MMIMLHHAQLCALACFCLDVFFFSSSRSTRGPRTRLRGRARLSCHRTDLSKCIARRQERELLCYTPCMPCQQPRRFFVVHAGLKDLRLWLEVEAEATATVLQAYPSFMCLPLGAAESFAQVRLREVETAVTEATEASSRPRGVAESRLMRSAFICLADFVWCVGVGVGVGVSVLAYVW